MKRSFYIFLVFVLTNGWIALPAPAQSETCEDPGSIPAAETTRELQLPQFGITLTIPSNFRAILRNDNSVEIVDSGTYELLNCIAQGGQALGRGYASTTVRSVSKPDDINLRQFVEQNTRLDGCISPYSWNEQRGYLVQSSFDRSAQFWFNPEATPDVVVISTSCDCEGMLDRLVTLLEQS